MLTHCIIQTLGNKKDDFDAIWGVLSSAFHEIHLKNASTLSFEELYRSSYKIVVLTSKGDSLYDNVKDLEQEWLSGNVCQRIVSSVSPVLLLDIDPADTTDQANERRAAGEKFLKAIKNAWEDHQLCMGMITDVLMYMVGGFFFFFFLDIYKSNQANSCRTEIRVTPRNPRSIPHQCASFVIMYFARWFRILKKPYTRSSSPPFFSWYN